MRLEYRNGKTYLIDTYELCKALLGRGFRLPLSGCIGFFEILKVDENGNITDMIRLNMHYGQCGSEFYDRYYLTDEETYDKINEWVRLATGES